MAFSDDDSAEWIESEHQALHSRLRLLQLPRASDDVRKRCWDEIGLHLANQERAGGGPPTPARSLRLQDL